MKNSDGFFNSPEEGIRNIVNQYLPLTQLEKGQKLSLTNKDLEETISYMGRAFQEVSRSLGSLSGYSQFIGYSPSKWETIASRIDIINATFQDFISQKKDCLSELEKKDLFWIRSQLETAAAKLEEMGNEAYKDDSTAQARFNQQSEKIRQLAKQVDVFTPPPQSEEVSD